ncbi:DNA-protecting protein DprA [Frankia sp. AgPm24]|uniref:DNA-processing protein DprA n=1 Tax=Frankia sp. AgPm24 TaxID=631128 RepID=UPI0020100EDC|nr:DNA-processing protein DprA [Frankia sp. AgPm24]MCK9921297.1 DNA-protecting protein DprA [Frankia sp. AgPm24]
MCAREERRARIGLACAAGVRTPPVPSGAVSPVGLWEQHAAAHPTIDPDRVEEEATRAGWRILVPGDAEWPTVPAGLPDIGAAPWALWVRGDADLHAATRRSVAVLGARASTAYGEHVAALLAGGLAASGWTVVSSCALGCDSHALAAATRSATPPIAVYAAELDLRAFERRVDASHALLVSDVPPGSPSRRDRFLARQDLLCYLSTGIVLVEAAWRSATFATVADARRRDRLVMAVPGPITSSTSAACHHLIRDHHATLVDSADAVTASLLAATTTTATSCDPAEGPSR